MFDYAATADSAHELIREYGAPVVLSRDVDAEYDVDTGIVEGTERRWNGFAFRWEFELRDVDGDTILLTDTRLLMSVFTQDMQPMQEPKNGDRVLFDGKWSTVVRSRPTKPATVAVCYDVQAR